jgi:hypothetical protein
MNCALALPEAKQHFVVIRSERDWREINPLNKIRANEDDRVAEAWCSAEASEREQPRHLRWSNGIGL